MSPEFENKMTMKKLVKKLDVELLKKDFPINDKLKDWFFRQDEISAGVYIVEGKDVWGRIVSKRGLDPEELLRLCIKDAKDIYRQLK